jgi:hypothetical protein
MENFSSIVAVMISLSDVSAAESITDDIGFSTDSSMDGSIACLIDRTGTAVRTGTGLHGVLGVRAEKNLFF